MATEHTQVEASEAIAARERSHTRHPSTREYVRIAIILAVVTAAEVAVYYVDALRDVLIPMLFVFAVVKFSLVVLWFMHLRFDSRTYARFFLMGLAGAVTLFLIVLLVFGTFGS
jgi:cytochrome c oxidase subunit 4